MDFVSERMGIFRSLWAIGKRDQVAGILLRIVWYTGAGIFTSSIIALTIWFWLPEPMHGPLLSTTHSLCVGVALALLIRSLGAMSVSASDE